MKYSSMLLSFFSIVILVIPLTIAVDQHSWPSFHRRDISSSSHWIRDLDQEEWDSVLTPRTPAGGQKGGGKPNSGGGGSAQIGGRVAGTSTSAFQKAPSKDQSPGSNRPSPPAKNRPASGQVTGASSDTRISPGAATGQTQVGRKGTTSPGKRLGGQAASGRNSPSKKNTTFGRVQKPTGGGKSNLIAPAGLQAATGSTEGPALIERRRKEAARRGGSGGGSSGRRIVSGQPRFSSSLPFDWAQGE